MGISGITNSSTPQVKKEPRQEQTAAPSVEDTNTTSPGKGPSERRQELEQAELAAKMRHDQLEYDAKIRHEQFEFARKVVGSVADVAKPIIAHQANMAAATHTYELQQKALDQQSRRAWDERFLRSLADGNCGYIENVARYDEYCKEVIGRNPAAEFSLGAQMKKCREIALLRREQSIGG